MTAPNSESVPIQSETLHVNGVRVHYLRAGHGPRTIVLTHGHSHCGGVWMPLIQSLARDEFTVIAPDMRGHGLSDKPDRGYDYSTLRDDLVGVVEALDLHNVLYVGHSRGGSVALLALAATAEQSEGAVIYEPTVAFQVGDDGRPAPIVDPERTAASVARASRRRDNYPSREDLVQRYRGRDGFRWWRSDYFDAFIAHGTKVHPDGSASLLMPSRVVSRLGETMFGFEAWRDLHFEERPILIVFGDRSGRLDSERNPIAAIRTVFPSCEIRVMPDATHTGPMEHPDMWEQIVREFASRETYRSAAAPRSANWVQAIRQERSVATEHLYANRRNPFLR